MSDSFIGSIASDVAAGVLFTTVLTFGLKLISDFLSSRRARDRVLAAEKEAFKTVPEAFAARTAELAASQEQLERRTSQLQGVLDQAQASLKVGLLFDLYNKQVEKYQTETQARAGWSFIFAIIAMFAGLGFVVWGGTVVVSGGGWEKVAAGSLISTIGGAVSAYITTTFLDVHRLSLLQLNRYFRQPVINANVLTAQRIADSIEEPEAKRQAYVKILDRVIELIREGDEIPLAPATRLSVTPKSTNTRDSKRSASRESSKTNANEK
jgi:hypothetical protein